MNNQFLQIVTRLQSPHVYGFGENNHDTLKHYVQERKSWGIFARGQGLPLDRIDHSHISLFRHEFEYQRQSLWFSSILPRHGAD